MNKWILVLATAGLATIAGSANASLISVDIDRAAAATSSNGVWASSTWNADFDNSLTEASFTHSGLLDSAGVTTGVGFTINSSNSNYSVKTFNNWTGGSPSPSALVDDGAYVVNPTNNNDGGSSSDTLTTTITGLAANGTYDLIVYVKDGISNVMTATAGAGNTGPTQYTGSINETGVTDAYGQPTSGGVTTGDFYYFQGITADSSGNLVFNTVGSGGYASLAGFQLQSVPEPASLALMGIGGLLLMSRKRAS